MRAANDDFYSENIFPLKQQLSRRTGMTYGNGTWPRMAMTVWRRA